MTDTLMTIGFLGEFFSDSHRATPQHEHPWARQGIAEAKEWSEAAVGFRNAVDTEEVQVPAAFVTESLSQTKKRPDVEAFFESNNNRSASLTAALPAGSASTQAFSTLAGRAGAATGPHRQESTVSILQELSQLPQQFADLTMEQVLALKRRCEIEMDAVRKKDEQILAARRGALSRADASRWQGWQEFQATPWY